VPFCEIEDKDYDRFALRSGDIVIARTGATVGYAKLIRDVERSVFASYLVRIRINPDKADVDYVGRIVESAVYKRFVQSQIGGAAQPNANAQILSSFKLPIPASPTQHRIAAILSAYDDLIETNRRRMALLEQAARLLYREWFVHLRFPGHEAVRVVDGAPEGWERRRIDEVAETVGGGTPSTGVPDYWDGDITWVVPTDVTRNDGIVLLDSERKITEKGLRESSARLVPANTILMTSRASVGFFALMDREVCTNQGFINVIPNEDALRMYLLFNLMYRVDEIRSNAKGSTYPEINKSTFRGLSVIVPPIEICREFSAVIGPMIGQIRNIKKQVVNLAQARDLLLPRLMNGEITV